MNLKLLKTDSLKPCPFCGCAEPELNNTHTPSYWISCPACTAEVHGEMPSGVSRRSHRAGVVSAIEKWNDRV